MRLLLLAGLSAGLATAASFTYNDFSSVAGLSLTGDAAQAGSVLRVVHNDVSLAGNAWYSSAVDFNPSTSFSTMFEFLITTPPGDPTDGFSFILQNDPAGNGALGAGGQGSGYVNLSPSVAVLFRGRAPSFIGVITNGVDPLPGVPPGATLFNENDFYNQNEFAWIDYDASSTTLSVYLSTTNVKPGTAVLSNSVDIASILGAQAYVGFGAGTGGAAGDNDILSWQFTSTPEPATMGLYGIGLVGLGLFRRRFHH